MFSSDMWGLVLAVRILSWAEIFLTPENLHFYAFTVRSELLGITST
jgi:hypothetical protein